MALYGWEAPEGHINWGQKGHTHGHENCIELAWGRDHWCQGWNEEDEAMLHWSNNRNSWAVNYWRNLGYFERDTRFPDIYTQNYFLNRKQGKLDILYGWQLPSVCMSFMKNQWAIKLCSKTNQRYSDFVYQILPNIIFWSHQVQNSYLKSFCFANQPSDRYQDLPLNLSIFRLLVTSTCVPMNFSFRYTNLIGL